MNQEPLSSWSGPALMEAWFDRINYERQTANNLQGFKLDAIERLLLGLGQPQLRYPIVHVAGTKGKGSVTRMVARMLESGGFRAAAYTSPHLERVHQRYEINRQEISESRLDQLLLALWPAIEACDRQADQSGHRRLTFFDIATALAFSYFAEERVDVAAIEVGLGGRLDSTNVCLPAVTVITSISLDHTRQLGNTLAQIAAEKAGIIKPGIPVVCGVLEPEPQSVIHAIAQERGAPVWQLDREFFAQHVTLDGAGAWFDLKTVTPHALGDTRQLRINGLGRHQVLNASLALMAVHCLIQRHAHLKVDSSFRQALIAHNHAGRIEVLREQPTVVIDVAHNEASMRALVATLKEQLPQWQSARRRVLILAISRDKDQKRMLELALGHFDRVILTRFLNNPRATDEHQLWVWSQEICAREGWQPELVTAATPQEAWALAAADAGANGLICVAGSLFLASELRPVILGSPNASPLAGS